MMSTSEHPPHAASGEGEVIETFESAAMPHVNDLFRTAMSLLANRSDAEDAVQECMLQAWKSFHRYQQGTNCRAWLYKILFHVVSHHRRKGKKWLFGDDPQILEERLPARRDTPDQLTDEDMLAALRQLPSNYSEVILLADVQEFSYKEIQETLGIPIGTVMSRLSRARDQLRKCLAVAGWAGN
jgi:RNA polymerase sigma-70 factor (ECF subfamily)